MLGVLGNRGVETRRAFLTLMDHRHDPDEQTRYWAIEGLSLLGTDETVAPLLEAFRSDSSPLVRERGGCGLAQSGTARRGKNKCVRAAADGGMGWFGRLSVVSLATEKSPAAAMSPAEAPG